MTQLLKTVKVVEDESLRSVRGLESALESMGQDIQSFYREEESFSTSTAEDLMKVMRSVAEATSKAVLANNSRKKEDIESVANNGRKVVTVLLATVKVKSLFAVLAFTETNLHCSLVIRVSITRMTN